nr:MAG TPA: hypothetical protein [Caudoviricetes sp.]
MDSDASFIFMFLSILFILSAILTTIMYKCTGLPVEGGIIFSTFIIGSLMIIIGMLFQLY